MKWNHDGSALGSGGKDHCLFLWDASMSSSRPHFDNKTTTTKVSARAILTHHKAAVKALAWCPFHRGVLASGGGAADVSGKNGLKLFFIFAIENVIDLNIIFLLTNIIPCLYNTGIH